MIEFMLKKGKEKKRMEMKKRNETERNKRKGPLTCLSFEKNYWTRPVRTQWLTPEKRYW